MASEHLTLKFASPVSPSKISPLVAAPVAAACEIIVIIPARDEAAHIEIALSALTAQLDLNGEPFAHHRYEVILLANNCADATAAIAHRFATAHKNFNLHVVETTLPAERAHVGQARRLLMDEAARRLRLVNRHHVGVIASTDADTRVAPTWLAATLAEIKSGADAVGGRIIIDTNADENVNAKVDINDNGSRLCDGTRTLHLRDTTYRHLAAELEARLDPEPHDPHPRHHQHFGASFAVTVRVYERVGRLPVVPYLEDLAFYHALRRHDALVRHSPQVRVVTSARRTGRAPVGLSFQLGEWEKMSRRRQSYTVESAASIERRSLLRAELRALWRENYALNSSRTNSSHARAAFAEKTGIALVWLNHQLQHAQTFGALLEAFETKQHERAASHIELVEITFALRQLRARLAVLRRHDVATLAKMNAASVTSHDSNAHEQIESVTLRAFAANVS